MDNINSFVAGARRIGVFPSYLFDVSEFAAGKRQDKLVKCLLKLEEIAVKAGIDRSSGESMLEFQRNIEEQDAKKDESARLEAEAHEKAEKEMYAQFIKEREESLKKDEAEQRELEQKEKQIISEAQSLSLQEREQKQNRLKAEREEKERARKEAEEAQAKLQKDREEKMKNEKLERDKKIAALKAQNSSNNSSSSSTPSHSPSISSGPPQKLSGLDALLYWSKSRCEAYGVEVVNFTTSWKDGLAFCALIHSYFPKALDFNACKTKAPKDRLAIAFDAAGNQGVPPLLDPEDVCDMNVPDRRSIITYVSCLYKGFKQ